VTVVPLSNEEPATGVNSAYGRAISGSGLGAQSGFSYCISALMTSERPARECDLSTVPTGWDGKTASERSSSISGRSGMQPGSDMEVSRLERAGKPMESISKRGFD